MSATETPEALVGKLVSEFSRSNGNSEVREGQGHWRRGGQGMAPPSLPVSPSTWGFALSLSSSLLTQVPIALQFMTTRSVNFLGEDWAP